VKSGVRALGVAESAPSEATHSTLAGAVVRADGTADGFALGTCEIGGTNATTAVVRLYDRLDRDDVQYVLVSGIALAWYNVLDLHRLYEEIERPVLSVSYEESPGLTAAIRKGVPDPESRVRTYESLPDRVPVTLNGERRFLRAVGCPPETAREVLRSFTPGGGRPEPVRVARLVARAAAEWRQEGKG
jgi:endonuclease V-like protein UPF0215 family